MKSHKYWSIGALITMLGSLLMCDKEVIEV